MVLIFYGLHKKWGNPNEYEVTKEAVNFLKPKLGVEAEFYDLMKHGKNRYRKIKPVLDRTKPKLVVDVHGISSPSIVSLGDVETATKYYFKEICSFLNSKKEFEEYGSWGPARLPRRHRILYQKQFANIPPFYPESDLSVRLINCNNKDNNPIQKACCQANLPFLSLEFYWKRLQDFADISAELLKTMKSGV